MNSGNLISIGPGMYPSNRTLAGGGRSILVLGSCEFMHNGTLSGLNYYVGSPDWMLLQVWRPVSLDAVSMVLVYERMIEPNASVDEIMQLRFDHEELQVQEGDRIGFTKLNHTFPIPYIFNPQMSADLWYNRVPPEIALPNVSDVITFEEMGFPYHFSVTVTFKAKVSRNPPGAHIKQNFGNHVLKPMRNDKVGLGSGKNHDIMMGDAGYDINAKQDIMFGGAEYDSNAKRDTVIENSNAKDSDLNSVYKPMGKESAPRAGSDIIADQSDGPKVNVAEERDPSDGSKMEDGTGSVNSTPLPELTEEHTSGDTAPHTAVSPTLLNNAAQKQSHPPSQLSDSSAQHTVTIVTTPGPKFIFDTVMQTFSPLIQTTEEVFKEEEDVTSDMTSELKVVTSDQDMTSQVPSDITDESGTELPSKPDMRRATVRSLESESESIASTTTGLPNDTTD